MIGPVPIDRDATTALVRELVARERARVDDPGAAIPGVDPDDGHGWHPWNPHQVAHPREPGIPVFHPACWRFFRLIDLGWLGDTLLITFAWDELGTPDLRYLTQVRFMTSLREHGPRALAVTARGHLRHLLAPSDAINSLHHEPADDDRAATAPWRQRCGRLWLDRDHVLVTPGVAPDQERLDRGWELPWPSLTNPPRA